MGGCVKIDNVCAIIENVLKMAGYLHSAIKPLGNKGAKRIY
jgi:hypothetical protein